MGKLAQNRKLATNGINIKRKHEGGSVSNRQQAVYISTPNNASGKCAVGVQTHGF